MKERDPRTGQFLAANSKDVVDERSDCDGILEQHKASLNSLWESFEQTTKVRKEGQAVEQELASLAVAFDEASQRLWAGEGSAEIERLHARKSAMERVAAKLDKSELVAAQNLQKRLPSDFAAEGRLYGHWVAFVEERETGKLLETLQSGDGRPELVEAARRLALAGKAYHQALEDLGPGSGVSYAWTRPLAPITSERSAANIQVGLVTGDPLFKPPERAETIANLLGAAEILLKRWTRLLEVVGAEGAFSPPSFEEPPPLPEPDYLSWQGPLADESVIGRELRRLGKEWSQLSVEQQETLKRMQASNLSGLRPEPFFAEQGR